MLSLKRNKVLQLAFIGMLTAVSVVLARFLGFYPMQGVRISFECVPILLAGIWLGPLAGGFVGGLADLLGSIISGLGFYPPLILTPIFVGVLSGLLARFSFFADKNIWKLVVLMLFTEIVCNLFWGTLPLSWLYETPYWTLIGVRLPWKLIIAAADSVFVVLLHRALYRPLLRKML